MAHRSRPAVAVALALALLALLTVGYGCAYVSLLTEARQPIIDLRSGEPVLVRVDPVYRLNSHFFHLLFWPANSVDRWLRPEQFS